MGLKQYGRHSAAVLKSKRWPALLFAAKRRDGFKCKSCGARGRLEVDHIKPVRTHPELGFEFDNLQTLCVTCHSRKTRIECGLDPLHPERQAWRELVRDMHRKPKETLCLSQ